MLVPSVLHGTLCCFTFLTNEQKLKSKQSQFAVKKLADLSPRVLIFKVSGHSKSKIDSLHRYSDLNKTSNNTIFRRVPQVAREKNLEGECYQISALVEHLNNEEQKMEREGDFANFSRSYHEPISSGHKEGKEGGRPVNIRAQRMIAYNAATKMFEFSTVVCSCSLCIDGNLMKCEVYHDHVKHDSYGSQRSQKKTPITNVAKAVGNVAKASVEIFDFVKPKPKSKIQIQTEPVSTPLDENRFAKDVDSEYSSTSDSEEEQELCIDLLLKCPNADSNGQTPCSEIPILHKYNTYLEGNLYERTDIIHKYVGQLRDKLQKPSIGFLSTVDLDVLYLETSKFECSNRKLITEVSKVADISKLKDAKGPVSLVLLLFAHKRMRRKHTLYCGETYTHDTEENRRQSKRATPGHYVACHINLTNGLVSVFDSLYSHPGEYSSVYFCDTAMYEVFSIFASVINQMRSESNVEIQLRQMPLQRTQTGSTCGIVSLLVSTVPEILFNL